jgi:hypothetical protein
MKVRAIYPLYPPLRFDSEFQQNVFWSLCDYFKSARTLKICGSDFHDGEVLRVILSHLSPHLKKTYFEKTLFPKSLGVTLEFHGSFKFPGKKKYFLADQNGKKFSHSAKQLRSIWSSFLPHELGTVIQSYFCALMLAFPGAARPVGNIWFVGGKSSDRSNPYFVSPIHDAIGHLAENGVFAETKLPLEKAAKWVFSQNGIFNGYSDTPASRALNYFTRLFVEQFRDDELSDLVWALAGIEALLVEGGRSSLGQLKEKFAALFSNETQLPWILSSTEKMYSYRSKMVHGNRQIRSAFRTDDAVIDDKRFDEEYYSQLFAIGMLLLLLQRAVLSNQSSFQFKTVLRS